MNAARELRSGHSAPLFANGIWTGVGFVALSALAAAVASAFRANAASLPTALGVVASVAIAAFAWRRAAAALERVEIAA